MTEKRLLELINRELDGLNAPHESEELKQHLSANAEAQRLYHDLARITTTLNRVEAVEPPAFVRAGIMEGIRAQHAVAESFSLVRWIREFIETRSRFEYAYVFAAGLLIGVALYSLVAIHPATDNVVDPSRVSGTVLLPDASSAPAAGEAVHFELEGGIAAGVVQSRFSPTVVELELDVRSEKELSVVIGYEAASLQFTRYTRLEHLASSLRVEEESLRIATTGEQRYTLSFERVSQKPSKVTLTFSSGKLRQQQTLLVAEAK